METVVSLSDYLERKKRQQPAEPRKPEWIRRQQQNRLPVQDRTAYIRRPDDAA